MRTLFIVLSMCAVFTLSGLFVTATGREQVDVKALFESKCSICHTIERPRGKKKTKEEWNSTVMRMKNTNGCPISDEEAQMIIDYLAENYGT